jgi:hypothetical protein
MRTLRVVGFVWLLTDCGAALGWLLGAPFDRQFRFLSATVVGTLAILFAIKTLVRLGWLNADRRRGGSIGGLCGFALAAPLAAMTLDQPIVSLAVLGFVGVAVLLGAGFSAAQ